MAQFHPHHLTSFLFLLPPFLPARSPFSPLHPQQPLPAHAQHHFPSPHPAPLPFNTMTTTSCPFAVAATPGRPPPAARAPSCSQGGTAGTASTPGTRAGLALQQRSPTAGAARAGVLALDRDPSGDTANARARWRERWCSGALERSPTTDGGTDQQRSLRPLGPAWVFTG